MFPLDNEEEYIAVLGYLVLHALHPMENLCRCNRFELWSNCAGLQCLLQIMLHMEYTVVDVRQRAFITSTPMMQ